MSLNERYETYKEIHSKAEELGLSEEAYRNTLKSLTGFSSCTELRPNELRAVLTFLNNQVSSSHPVDCFCDACALEVLL